MLFPAQGVPGWLKIYEQLLKTNEFLWKVTKADGDPSSIATDYAELLMERHPNEELVKRGLFRLEPNVIQDILQVLVPDRMTVLLAERQGQRDGSAQEGWTEHELPYYGVKFLVGRWDTAGLTDIQSKGTTDSYVLPQPYPEPPVFDLSPTGIRKYIQPYSESEPFGPSPMRSEEKLWHRWGSSYGDLSFGFKLTLFTPLAFEEISDPHYARHMALLSLWATNLANKLIPVEEETKTCSAGVSILNARRNMLGVGFKVAGHYSETCVTALNKLVDIVFGLNEHNKGSAIGLRTREGRSVDLTGRSLEALYLELVDNTNTMPYKDAMGALGDIVEEDSLTREEKAKVTLGSFVFAKNSCLPAVLVDLFSTLINWWVYFVGKIIHHFHDFVPSKIIKVMKDEWLATTKKPPLPEPPQAENKEEFLVDKEKTQLPVNMQNAIPATPPQPSNHMTRWNMQTTSDVDQLFAKILFGNHPMWAQGIAIGSITEQEMNVGWSLFGWRDGLDNVPIGGDDF